jgi:ferredoxin
MAFKLFITKGGVVTEIIAKQSAVLAQVIKNSGLVGSGFAQCGFNLECGTCAVKVKPIIQEPDIEEEILLKSIGKYDNYRCSCQVILTEDMNNASIEID